MSSTGPSIDWTGFCNPDRPRRDVSLGLIANVDGEFAGSPIIYPGKLLYAKKISPPSHLGITHISGWGSAPVVATHANAIAQKRSSWPPEG